MQASIGRETEEATVCLLPPTTATNTGKMNMSSIPDRFQAMTQIYKLISYDL